MRLITRRTPNKPNPSNTTTMNSQTSNASNTVPSNNTRNTIPSMTPRARFLANRSSESTLKTASTLAGFTMEGTSILSVVTAVAVALMVVPGASANLLVDPGFETNPLTTASNVLNNFALFEGQWGDENATITAAVGSIIPPQGAKMLREVSSGGTATQTFQATDVTSYLALIDSGDATINLSALFNVDSIVSAAGAGLSVQFFTGANYGTLTSSLSGGLVLDTDADTWQSISASGAIPVGTRWLVSQVLYNNASLAGNPGFVDAAELTVVPEPTSLACLVWGAAILGMRRARSAKSKLTMTHYSA